MTFEMLEEYLPDPVNIEINSDPDIYNMEAHGCLTSVRKKHNEVFHEEIRAIFIHFVTADENPRDLNWNEYSISVGGKEIIRGKGPEDDTDMDKLSVFYQAMLSIMKTVLNEWHDDIIEQQNKNDEKIKELEAEGYDEICYAYYSMLYDKRAFIFLKKLAERYPNTEYFRTLSRVYIDGAYGWHQRNKVLGTKLRNRRRKKSSLKYF